MRGFFVAPLGALVLAFLLLIATGSPALADSRPTVLPANPIVCPQVMPAPCKAGTVLKWGKDARGCNMPYCDVETPANCVMPQIGCGPGQRMVFDKGADGCPKPRCIAQPAGCPSYKSPVCAKDERLDTQIDAKGCEKQVCIAQSNVCPQYKELTCPPDSRPVIEKMEDGCDKPVCQKLKGASSAPSCPKYPAARCPAGQVQTVEQDARGCPRPACAPDKVGTMPAVNCQAVRVDCTASPTHICCGAPTTGTTPAACPKPMKPLCKQNETTERVLGANGCETFTCKKKRYIYKPQ